MRLRWLLVAILVVALAPKPVTAFCQGVVGAAMSVFNELTASTTEG